MIIVAHALNSVMHIFIVFCSYALHYPINLIISTFISLYTGIPFNQRSINCLCRLFNNLICPVFRNYLHGTRISKDNNLVSRIINAMELIYLTLDILILFIRFLLCITEYKHSFIRTILISVLISSRNIAIAFSIYQRNLINIIPDMKLIQPLKVLIFLIAFADNAYLMLV